MKYTPGPWSTNQYGAITAYLPGISPEDVAGGQHYYVPIGETAYKAWMSTDWLISVDEYMANAKLMAAAPDLYEAAKEAAEAIFNGTADQYHSDLLNAAIAKAEGR